MIKRLIEEKIIASKKSVLLLGPRQTGKSTLINGLHPDLTINLAKENEFLRHSMNIDLFSEEIANQKLKTIFVDEIQRIPGLLNTIQATLDEAKGKRNLRFFLSKSSARKLRRGQANLLPGRIFSYQLGGIAASETKYQVDFEHALKYGFLPEPFCETDSATCEKFLETYAATYLKEEIQAEALSRNIQGFARFLLSLAASSGQVLDFSKLAAKSKVARSTCIRYVEILEDTLIAQRIFSFADAGDADVIRHPKVYFFDGGVLNGLLNNFQLSEDRKGFLFEHLVYSQIRNSLLANDLPPDISFFRTRHGIEVDFVVKLRGKIWAIEVKTGDIASYDLRGLKAFQQYHKNVHRSLVVTTKTRKRFKEGIMICDWLTLLQEMFG